MKGLKNKRRDRRKGERKIFQNCKLTISYFNTEKVHQAQGAKGVCAE